MSALRSSLLALLALTAASLAAQGLPDVERLEIKNYRVIFLDDDGRRAVLEGSRAHKRADGLVQVDDAKLRVFSGEDVYSITAKEFNYSPKTGAFACPSGLSTELPDGGTLTFPPGKGELSLGDPLTLKLTSPGDATLKTGDGALSASIKDPTASLELDTVKAPNAAGKLVPTGFKLKKLELKSTRGASMTVKLDSVPNLQGEQTEAASVTLGCFGDASLELTDGGERASLSMLRRASMQVLSENQDFQVTSEYIELQGDLKRVPRDEKKPKGEQITVLTNVQFTATSNVQLRGKGMRGRGGELTYRQLPLHTELRLGIYPELTLDRGEDEDTKELIAMNLRADDYVDVFARNTEGGGSPQSARVELFGGANVKRLRNGVPDWQIVGTQVRLFSWRDTAKSYSHSFDVVGQGFSPLLSVFPGAVPGAGEAPEVSRATVTGSRAEGTLIGNRCDVRVDGPETMAVVYADFAMADVLRTALGLRSRAPIPRRDGRLTVNARDTLELGVLTTRDGAGDLRIAAHGQVSLVHYPLPRDDANLVSLTGSVVAVELVDGILRSADLAAEGTEGAVATLGYDLLLAGNLRTRGSGGVLVTEVDGPGRLVVRDRDSIQFFLDTLNRLPRRNPEERDLPSPDAGWVEFGSKCTIASLRDAGKEESRTLEIEQPRAFLVYGDFEPPRAGASALNDLAELRLPEVQHLYHLSGERAFMRSFRSLAPGPDGEEPPAINVLRLEGDAVVRSDMDGVDAAASTAIEITGAQGKDGSESPFTAVLLGSSQLHLERAAEFFGQYVRTGVFSYDGEWVLKADDRLELTMRPVDTVFPGKSLKAVRDLLGKAVAKKVFPRTSRKVVRDLLGEAVTKKLEVAARIEFATQARDALARAIGDIDTGAENVPAELEQPRKALDAIDAARAMLSGETPLLPDQDEDSREKEALGGLRRARKLLDALIDIAARGGLEADFYARNVGTPPMNLTLRDLVVTFNGAGDVIALDATGPILLKRDQYELRGSRLSQGKDGSAKLDGAAIKLPDDTGVTVEGMRSISLVPTENRGVMTRVSGVRMRVRIKLGQSGQE